MLMRKLNYLRQLVGVSEDKLSSQIFHAFAGRDVSELTIIEQCRHLESVYEIKFTSEILTSADSWASIQKRILSADKELRVNRANTRRSLKHLSAIHSEISWLKIWDMVLDYGIQGSKSALCLFRTLSHPLFGDRPCPRCKTSIPEDVTYLEHLTCNHQELELSSVEKIMELLISASPDLITVGYRLIHASLLKYTFVYNICVNNIVVYLCVLLCQYLYYLPWGFFFFIYLFITVLYALPCLCWVCCK